MAFWTKFPKMKLSQLFKKIMSFSKDNYVLRIVKVDDESKIHIFCIINIKYMKYEKQKYSYQMSHLMTHKMLTHIRLSCLEDYFLVLSSNHHFMCHLIGCLIKTFWSLKFYVISINYVKMWNMRWIIDFSYL